MRRTAHLIAAAAVAIAFGGAPAGAAVVRTFVSGQGVDTGTCAVTAPCRSFAYAITQTAAAGEIVVLNSAGYGTVTISQAVSITNEEGVEAAVSVASGDGITVSAGGSDTVTLTGITLTGGGGANGITFSSGGTLNVVNCVARGFTSNGLNLVPATNGANANVVDTVVADNANDGIDFAPSVIANAVFHRVVALGNSNVNILVDGSHVSVIVAGAAQAVAALPAVEAIASDTIASGNSPSGSVATNYGYEVVGQVPGAAVVRTVFVVANSKTSGGANGVTASNGIMYLNGTTITGTTQFGFDVASGGTIATFGNNANTASSNSGTLTSVALQ